MRRGWDNEVLHLRWTAIRKIYIIIFWSVHHESHSVICGCSNIMFSDYLHIGLLVLLLQLTWISFHKWVIYSTPLHLMFSCIIMRFCWMSLQLLNLEITILHILSTQINKIYEIPAFLLWHRTTKRFFGVSPLHILIRTHVKVSATSLKLTFTPHSQLRWCHRSFYVICGWTTNRLSLVHVRPHVYMQFYSRISSLHSILHPEYSESRVCTTLSLNFE